MGKLEPFYGAIFVIAIILCTYFVYWAGHTQGVDDMYGSIDLALTHDGRGYFIVNGNYGSFHTGVGLGGDRGEALKVLLGEISPCLLNEYMCEKKLPGCYDGVCI